MKTGGLFELQVAGNPVPSFVFAELGAALNGLDLHARPTLAKSAKHGKLSRPLQHLQWARDN